MPKVLKPEEKENNLRAELNHYKTKAMQLEDVVNVQRKEIAEMVEAFCLISKKTDVNARKKLSREMDFFEMLNYICGINQDIREYAQRMTSKSLKQELKRK